jgi:hypothetical protein
MKERPDELSDKSETCAETPTAPPWTPSPSQSLTATHPCLTQIQPRPIPRVTLRFRNSRTPA